MATNSSINPLSAVNNSSNELRPGNPFAALPYNTTRYYGSIHILNATLHAIGDSYPRAIEILGLPGMGKTFLLRHLASPGRLNEYSDRFQAPYRSQTHLLFPLLVEFTAKPEHTNPTQYLYERYQDAYLTYYGVNKDSFEGDESLKKPDPITSSSTGTIDALFKEFRELAAHRIRPILFLDDFNLVFNAFKEQEVEQMRRWRDYTTLILCTEERLYNINPKSSTLFGTFDPQNLKGLLPNEASRLLQEPTEQVGSPFPENDVKNILTLVGMHPGLLILSGKYLWEFRQQLVLGSDQPLNNQQYNILKERLRAVLLYKLEGYWNRMSDAEKLAAKRLAKENTISSPDMAIYTLETKGLVNLGEGLRYRFFSELFSEFVQFMVDEPIISSIDFNLTPLEDKLFTLLNNNFEHPCSFEEIWSVVWGKPYKTLAQKTRVIQVTVSRLNIKLRDRNLHVSSMPKFGYKLESIQLKGEKLRLADQKK